MGVGFILYELAQEYAFPVVVSEAEGIRLHACFTPQHNCQARLLKRIQAAQSEILMMCYGFSDAFIADALLIARARGVSVKILTDKTQVDHKKSQIPRLIRLGVPVYSDDTVALAHNKVLIIDTKIVTTGSYNFSEAAQKRNAENILVIESPEIAKQYKTAWQTRQSQARLITGLD